MAYTQGEWTAMDSEVIVSRKEGGVIMIADDIYSKGDAKLIAAAPDLLTACVEWFYLKTYHPAAKDTGIKTESEVFELMRKAIDKATK